MAVIPDYNTILAQQQQASTQAIQPALQSLQAQQDPLKARYSGLIEQLKGRQTTDITEANRATSEELGRRGIYGGGLVDEIRMQKTQPINQYYAGQETQIGYDREAAIAQLASQIAGLQSGAGQNAIQAAMGMYNTQLGQYQNEQQRAFQAQQAALDRAAQQRAAGANQGNLAAVLAGLNKPTSAPQQQLSQAQREGALRNAIVNWPKGATFLDFVRNYAPYLPLYQIKNIYNTTSPYGKYKENDQQVYQAYVQGGGR